MSDLLINVSDFETRVALLENGSLQEIHLDRGSGESVTGNIFRGKVVRIVPGMQAAFVEIGLARPGFLHARDMIDRHADPGGLDTDIRDLLHDGQEILVQVAKDPISSKGARLTTSLAIASRYLVLMPHTDHIGISTRIEDETERERLRSEIDGSRADADNAMGFIARTAAEGADAHGLGADLRYLVRTWRVIDERQRGSAVGEVIYEELPLHIRAVRDFASPDLERIVIDHDDTYERVERFVTRFLPEFEPLLSRHDDPTPLFERFSVEDDLERALSSRVELKSGGYLVIEQTEAMTTIDVNTGGYLGGSNLEETVYRTNLEAAAAIPKQLRLRNLGGIIVVDFIDMVDLEHQRGVLRVLEKGCEVDTARLKFGEISSLGLVEMSRKRTRKSLTQQLCRPCTVCDGRGFVKTAQSICFDVFRAIEADARRRPGAMASDELADDGAEYLVRAEQGVVDRLLDEDAEYLSALSERIGRTIRIQVETVYTPEQYDVVLVQGVQR